MEMQRDGDPYMEDHVVEPSHYTQYELEPITFIMGNDPKGVFVRGNIVKYTMRAGSKLYEGLDPIASEIRDFQKVIRYAEMRIEQLQERYNNDK